MEQRGKKGWLFWLLGFFLLLLGPRLSKADCGQPHGSETSPPSSTPSTTPSTSGGEGGGSSTGISTTPSTGEGHNVSDQLGRTLDPGGGKGTGGSSVFDSPGGGGGDRIKVDPFEVRKVIVEQVTETLRDIDRQKQLKIVLKPHINALKEARQNLNKVSKDYSRAVHELSEASKEVHRWREVHSYYKGSQEGRMGTYEKATRERLEKEMNDPKYQEAVRNEREALQRWSEARQGVDKAINNINEAKQYFKSGPQILDLPPVQ